MAMGDLTTTSSSVPQRLAPAGQCEYCGAPLVPEFYFCLRCATPHRSVESVLPAAYVARPTAEQLIQRKAPHVWPMFFTFMGVIVSVGIICYLAFGEESPELSLIVQTAALSIVTFVYAAVHWASLAVQLKRFGFFHWAAWAGLGLLVPLLAVNYAYHGWIMEAFGQDVPAYLRRLREAELGEPLLIVLFCVFPGVLEEVAFRGLVQHWLHVAIRPWQAMVVGAALFTAMHFSILSFPYLFAAGMVLGWVKFKTRSLYPSMLIHFLHNLLAIEVLWGP